MPSAEIIAIGTELLLGEISDTNTSYIAKALNQIGVDIFRTLIVGDNSQRITDQILQSLQHTDIVITTGGLGPTVDDPTRQAVADVHQKKLVFQEELWEQIQNRYQKFNKVPTLNNKRQAYIPENSVAIENAVGTAPAFYIFDNGKTIICLPGVPAEMEFLMNEKVLPLLGKLYKLESTIHSRIIHTAGIGESSLDDLIGNLEILENPTVGVTAKPGQVDIRVTAKAKSKREAQKLILPVEEMIMQKVRDHVYGFDQDTLQNVVKQLVSDKKIKITLFTKNTDLEFVDQIINLGLFQKVTPIIDANKNTDAAEQILYNTSNVQNMTAFIEANTQLDQGFTIRVVFNGNSHEQHFGFGGYSKIFNSWMENYLLNFIREVIIREGENE